MTHFQFSDLSFIQQVLITQQLGVNVSKRTDQVANYFLFQLDAFYIEVRVDVGQYGISEITAFPGNANLNSYLESIDISRILPENNP